MEYVKAEYLEALNKNTSQVEKVKFIPPSPEGDDLGGVSRKYIEATQKAIEELADKKITKFYASNQGNTHLPDSDKGKIQDMYLYGKSEQVQYKGYNKLTLRDAQQINTGIECKPVGLKLQFKGTATSTYCTFDAKEVVISAGTKVTAYTDSKKDWFIWLRDSDNKLYTLNQSTKTGTYDKDVTIKQFGLQNYQSGDSINELVDFGLMVGSESYEPYTGGIPSPNPDYPQEIKAVVNPKVVVRGKNLWDNFKTLSSGNVEQKNGAYIATKDTMQVDIMPDSTGKRPLFLKANNTYTFSLKTSVSILRNKYVCLVYTNGEKENIAFKSKNFINFVPKIDVEKIGFILYGSVVGDKIYDVQLEMGSETTPYEPYTEQSIQLPYTLYAIPVTTGGNITIENQQYVADYVDVERGKLVRMCKYKKLLSKDVDDVWSDKSLIILTDEIWDVKGNYLKRTFNILCSIGISTLETVANDGWKGKGKIKIKNAQFTNVNEAINYLNIHDAYVCYFIPTPEEIDLTPEQIQAFKSLSTNYPVTNIEVSSEQLDGYTIFNYPISMAEGWNYVKQQIGDTRDYIYDMDLQSAEAYVNSEYAVALTELEV